MSYATKTYPFSLDADRFIREGIVTTVGANAVASTTITLNSISGLGVANTLTFINPATQALVAGPVAITNINTSTNVVTIDTAITTSIGDQVARYFTPTAQMIVGLHIVNLNPEPVLVVLTSIDGSRTHGYFGAAAGGVYSTEIEFMAVGGIKIAAVTGVTSPVDVKITIFAKNLG